MKILRRTCTPEYNILHVRAYNLAALCAFVHAFSHQVQLAWNAGCSGTRHASLAEVCSSQGPLGAAAPETPHAQA